MTRLFSHVGLVLLLTPFLAGLSFAQTAPKQQGNDERGRAIFNGKGICFYCHGRDGHLAQRPQLNAATTAFIDRLNPKPADLRKPGSLKLHTDERRFRAIREGHPGTGMFPDATLTDQEITDTLAYLATLRREAPP